MIDSGHALNPTDTRFAGATPLMWAARWGHTEPTRVLLEAGADHTLETDDGKSVHHWVNEETDSRNVLYNVSGDEALNDLKRMLNEL